MSDALDKARKLLEETTKPKETPQEVAKKAHDSKQPEWVRNAFNKAAQGYRAVEPYLSKLWWPVTHVAYPVAAYGAKKWWNFFKWAAWKPDENNSEEWEFSRKRAAAALTATAVAAGAVWYGTKPVLRMAWDNVESITTREEDFYTFGVETIEDGEVYMLKVSDKLSPTPEETYYMRIENDYSLRHWNIYPEYVASAVPPEVAHGTVTYTGLFRSKIFDIHYEAKDVKLTPLRELPAETRAELGLNTLQP